MAVPEAVSVAELPSHIDGLAVDAVTVGCAPTFTVTVCELVQPFAAVPVTVYVVVTAGVTVTFDPVSDPGIHEYVEAPVTESVTLLPVQIDPEEAVGVTVGDGFTVIKRVDVFVQPFADVPVTV